MMTASPQIATASHPVGAGFKPARPLSLLVPLSHTPILEIPSTWVHPKLAAAYPLTPPKAGAHSPTGITRPLHGPS